MDEGTVVDRVVGLLVGRDESDCVGISDDDIEVGIEKFCQGIDYNYGLTDRFPHLVLAAHDEIKKRGYVKAEDGVYEFSSSTLIINKVKEHVLEQCRKPANAYGMSAYDYHFVPAIRYALKLAESTDADKEIVEVSTWLHDIWSIVADEKGHHSHGADYAERLLREYEYPQDKIDKVKHCIYAHRASQDIPRETIEAECVANADAMSHFDNIHSLFTLAIRTKGLDSGEARNFVMAKLQRSWNKLTPNAQKMIHNRYVSAKVLFDNSVAD